MLCANFTRILYFGLYGMFIFMLSCMPKNNNEVNIIPKPNKISVGASEFTTSSLRIYLPSSFKNIRPHWKNILKMTEVSENQAANVLVFQDQSLKEETYRLSISKKKYASTSTPIPAFITACRH